MMKKTRYDSGQALLFVVVAMTIALAVGISSSIRMLSTISRTTATDTSSRVSAAAEGGLERFLTKSTDELDSLAGSCTTYEEAADLEVCTVDFVSTIGEESFEARAVILVEEYGSGDSFEAGLEEGAVLEVALAGKAVTDVTLCWNGDSDLYYASYADDYYLGGIICPIGASCPRGGDTASTMAVCMPDYTNGYVLQGIDSSAVGIRIFSLRGDAEIKIVNETVDVSFPRQGHRFTSIGELSEFGTVQATRTVAVTRSLPFLPAMFDFGVYSGGGLP